MAKRALFAAMMVCFLIIIISCNNSNKKNSDKRTETPVKKIFTGENIEVAKKIISPDGGSILINKPGDPLDGLSIEVPANAYDDENEFVISYSKIERHDLGPDFNPVTPLISINNGAGDSYEPMKLKIPVKVGEGQFAMPFLYDATTGELEAMQVVDSEDGYITAYTTRFSVKSETGNSAVTNKKVVPSFAGDIVDVGLYGIIVSALGTDKLLAEITTPFKPGVDDWEFRNWGSNIAPGGHCAGQALGMLWYYSYKKSKGGPSLNGLFDNNGRTKTPWLWEDDAYAYRFCSMLQVEWANSNSNDLLEWWQGNNDLNTMYAFAYAMIITKQPQLVVIYPKDKDSASHAMVIYGMKEGTLFVADPNFPGDTTRRIWFGSGEGKKWYAPYNSSDYAGSNAKEYPKIHYLAKSGITSWGIAAEHWQKMGDGNIGKEKFPEYTIVGLNGNDEFVPFKDGFEVTNTDGWLTLMIRSPGWSAKFRGYSETARLLKENNMIQLPLKSEQLVGINILDNNDKWVNFEWVKVKMPAVDPGEIQPWTKHRVSMDLYIDGVILPIDSAVITAGDKFNLEGYSPRLVGADHDYTHFISIFSANVQSPGNYIIDDGTHLWIHDDKNDNKNKSYYPGKRSVNNKTYEADLSYAADKGVLQMDTWQSKKISGRFHFWIKDESGNRKLVKAEFRPYQ